LLFHFRLSQKDFGESDEVHPEVHRHKSRIWSRGIKAHLHPRCLSPSVAMEFGTSAEGIARSCHAHPTLSDAVKGVAMAVDKHAIHS
jgi:hypothetical protein